MAIDWGLWRCARPARLPVGWKPHGAGATSDSVVYFDPSTAGRRSAGRLASLFSTLSRPPRRRQPSWRTGRTGRRVCGVPGGGVRAGTEKHRRPNCTTGVASETAVGRWGAEPRPASRARNREIFVRNSVYYAYVLVGRLF